MMVAAAPAVAQHSVLWGRDGDRYDPAGRLPDFSYAGYHRGEKPLPEPAKPQVSVRDFGAVGDGKTDDTAAFQKAFDQAGGKVIAVPPGRYIITDFIYMRQRGTVLIGDDPAQCVLYFPRTLEDVKPNPGQTTSGRPTSNYSWSGGFVRIRGRFDSATPARITADAPRGSTTLQVDKPHALQVGDELRLQQSDTPDNSLAEHLYANDPSKLHNVNGHTRPTWIVRITAINADAKTVTIDRPLLCDARPQWNPVLRSAASSAEEIGIENLTFEFPVTDYEGHFTELGRNAIAFDSTRHCWARRIIIRHADSGIFINGYNNTLTDITLTSDRRMDRTNTTGHHGIQIGGADNLVAGFNFETHFIHDLTVASAACGNVFMNGNALDLSLDHHRRAPFANLFTHIDAGLGRDLFRSGGGAALGRHSAAWTTLWNITTDRPQTWPDGWGPDLMNLVAVTTDQPPIKSTDGRWFEPIAPAAIQPVNLYDAQLKRRLTR
ncbi:hypothetical protein HED60_13550 [Planctomycetales bacterium ZRK34]|nr:hypothetical protein HED60_13550 [Planctomycetales bacterium ZRK34]